MKHFAGGSLPPKNGHNKLAPGAFEAGAGFGQISMCYGKYITEFKQN